MKLDARRRKAEFWIYLGVNRGRGVGRAAVLRMLSYAFGELDLNRVAVRVLATNCDALRFWESLGFRTEGRLREDTWVDDEPVDAYCLGLLAREWQGRDER
jgi:ribosomal-protein-serine acetyltransferase